MSSGASSGAACATSARPDSRVHPCARSPRSIGTIIGLNQLNFVLGINPQAIPDWHTHEHFYERVYESLKHADKARPWNRRSPHGR